MNRNMNNVLKLIMAAGIVLLLLVALYFFSYRGTGRRDEQLVDDQRRGTQNEDTVIYIQVPSDEFRRDVISDF